MSDFLKTWKASSRLRDMEGQSQPLKVAPVHQNLFTVYDSNAAAFGRVADAELRRKIVRFYTSAKTLVALLNEDYKKVEVWERLRVGTGVEPSQSQQMVGDLLNWSARIQKLFSELRSDVVELIELIDRYPKKVADKLNYENSDRAGSSSS